MAVSLRDNNKNGPWWDILGVVSAARAVENSCDATALAARETANAAREIALAAQEARYQTARISNRIDYVLQAFFVILQAFFVILLLIAVYGCRYLLTSGEYVVGEVALIRTVAVLCISIAFCTTVNLFLVCVLNTESISFTGHFVLAICICVIYLCVGKIVGYDRIF